MANTLGDMVVSIVGDTAGFNKSLDDTQKKMIDISSFKQKWINY